MVMYPKGKMQKGTIKAQLTKNDNNSKVKIAQPLTQYYQNWCGNTCQQGKKLKVYRLKFCIIKNVQFDGCATGDLLHQFIPMTQMY